MKITFNKLTTEELATLADRVIHSSKNGNYTVVENHPLLQEIEKEYVEYRKVYEKATYSGKGTEVANADRKRDKIFSGIKAYIMGYSKLEYLPNYQYAKDLYRILKQFGLGLDKLNYAKETAKIKILIEELNKVDNKNKITALNLDIALTEFKNANDLFESLYAEQAEANSDLRALPSASAMRKNLESALNDYFLLLEGMKRVEGWEGIYYDINELVKGIQ